MWYVMGKSVSERAPKTSPNVAFDFDKQKIHHSDQLHPVKNILGVPKMEGKKGGGWGARKLEATGVCRFTFFKLLV